MEGWCGGSDWNRSILPAGAGETEGLLAQGKFKFLLDTLDIN